MGVRKSKWGEQLKAAETSGLSLNAYAVQHQINVRRLYEARRLRVRQGTTAWSVVRVKSETALQVAPKMQRSTQASGVAMQARLGNGVVLSWSHDQVDALAPHGVLRMLAALPCFI